MLTLDKVFNAQTVLKDIIRETSVVRANGIAPDCKLYLKPENLQITGSFKVRGAGYKIKMLSEEEKRKGVIACSAGNHAQGVALAASRCGIKSLICLPDSAPISKVEATKGYGADVCLVEGCYDDAYQKALELKERDGYTFVHPFDDENVIAGQGTVGLEIMNDLDDIDAIIVPVGGGGLISGIAYAVKQIRPSIKIYGVQSAGAAGMYSSVKNGKIEFQNVSFRYYKDSAEKVLDQINLTIEPGQMIGIIGSTGCGKTTLVSMIPRLYDVDEGKVLVDGIDVRDYSLNHLREGVGMVLQKNVLFSGTIEENLQWGDENADKDQIREAAESAQAEGFIQKLADGYDTELGQGGVNVSGGQKQRLCIARALLKRPKILILDDSTSAVDTATEARIREAFSTTLKETTKLIIAQRIGSVMEAEKIVGLGKHEALLETCKAYQEIYDSQMKKEVIA